MFFVEKSLFMRTIYELDINSSHIDREIIAQDTASFIDLTKLTSQDASAKEFLVLTISPNIYYRRKHPNVRC